MDRLVLTVHIGTKEMTTGIYSLYWEEQDLIYIGLSQNIEIRHNEHLRDLKNQKHTNYKVQNAFNSFGIPTLFILEKCLIEELNIKEIQWTAEFDALGKQGLCIVEGGQVGFGTKSSGSKHSRREVLKVFSLLYRTELLQTEIAEKLKVPISLVNDISKGRTHLWLKSAYTDKYNNIAALKRVRQQIATNTIAAAVRGRVYPTLKSPEGEVYSNILNVQEFCRAHVLLKDNWKNSSNGINRVLNSLRKSYKGWKLAD